MRRLCDLHTHSTASDGRVSPERLIALAESKRLAAVALTDHDTLAGLAPAMAAARQHADLRFVPGIEVSVTSGAGDAHVLGLDVDPEAELILDVARRLREAREQRNPEIVRRLTELGVEITLDQVLAVAGGDDADIRVVGRPHIAAVLVAAGRARTVAEAFKRYLAKGAAAYVERRRPTVAEAVDAIHAAGGAALLAHPVHLGFANFAQGERMVRCFVEAGIDGLEAYHTDHSDVMVRFLLGLARRLGLIVTGGSDFHGRDGECNRIGCPRVPAAVLTAFDARIEAIRNA